MYVRVCFEHGMDLPVLRLRLVTCLHPLTLSLCVLAVNLFSSQSISFFFPSIAIGFSLCDVSPTWFIRYRPLYATTTCVGTLTFPAVILDIHVLRLLSGLFFSNCCASSFSCFLLCDVTAMIALKYCGFPRSNVGMLHPLVVL